MSLDNVRIAKDGKLLGDRWISETKSHKTEDLTEDLYMHMNNVCDIDEGVTLKDIMLLVRSWTDLLSPLVTGGPEWLKEIVEEGLTVTPTEKSSLDCLILTWRADLSDWSKTGIKDLNIYGDFHGYGDPPKDDELYKDWPQGKKERYAVELTPVNNLAHLEVKLDKKIAIVDAHDYKREPYLEAEKNFTLFEILYGIFWELSFFGSPTNRNKTSQDLSKSIEDIESGKAKMIPFEDIKSMFAEDACDKCDGAGWVYGRELDNADEDTINDTMTKYTCDRCNGSKKEPKEQE